MIAQYQFDNYQLDIPSLRMQRLSALLHETLRHRNISIREFARLTGIDHTTLGRYITPEIKSPRDKVIRAIAPYVFKFKNFNNDGSIEVDLSQTYKNWIELKALIKKFDNLDMNKTETLCTMQLPDLIKQALQKNKITQSQLEKRLADAIVDGTSEIDLKRLHEIQSGGGLMATDQELQTIILICDPKYEAFSYEEWVNSIQLNHLGQENNHTNNNYQCGFNSAF
jgi:transcriptional regulator with XRE-family HTH domain